MPIEDAYKILAKRSGINIDAGLIARVPGGWKTVMAAIVAGGLLYGFEIMQGISAVQQFPRMTAEDVKFELLRVKNDLTFGTINETEASERIQEALKMLPEVKKEWTDWLTVSGQATKERTQSIIGATEKIVAEIESVAGREPLREEERIEEEERKAEQRISNIEQGIGMTGQQAAARERFLTEVKAARPVDVGEEALQFAKEIEEERIRRKRGISKVRQVT